MSTDEAQARPEDVERPSSPEPEAPRRRRSALRRALIGMGVLALVLAALLAGGFFFLENRYAGNIDRVKDVFAGLDQSSRPAPASPNQSDEAAPITFLLMGSETRAPPKNSSTPDGRSDGITLVPLCGDLCHELATQVPHQSWVV